MKIQTQLILQLLLYRDTDTLLCALASGKRPSAQLLKEFSQYEFMLGQQVAGTYGTNDQRMVIYQSLNNNEDSKYDIFQLLYSFSACHLTLTMGGPICRYRNLLTWNDLTRWLGEDVFTTAYLAKTDITAGTSVCDRTFFQWPAYLHHDNQALNEVMKKSISELHAHQKGSTLNFELSWLSLMNQISGRRKAFQTLSKDVVTNHPFFRGDHVRDLYMLVSIAAFIRLILFQKLRGISVSHEDTICQLEHLIRISHSDYAATERRLLQSAINMVRHQYGQHYSCGDLTDVPDYAIPACQTGLLTVLTGERWFLYTMFSRVYGVIHLDSFNKLLFYLYLHIKTLFRNELIQTNLQIGFHNFSLYEQRKELFIPEGSVYERQMTFLALGTFLAENPEKRYMESRIKPKDTACGNFNKLLQMQTYLSKNPYHVDVSKWQHALVYHFIKTKDGKCCPDSPRHQALRHEVMLEAKAICRIHQFRDNICDLVAGADAANSEIYCRPEVFAQAFRFLRYQSCYQTHRLPIGFTYHVGEDFYDIVSGLRAVDEVLKFLGFCANDRLGHGLVLGTDVRTYYEKRGFELQSTNIDQLDNAVWLYFEGQKLNGFEQVCHFLYIFARQKFLEIYAEDCFDIYDYHDSWLLRGDAPAYYLQEEKERSQYNVSLDPWIRYTLNDKRLANEARKNPHACRLYAKYHYDSRVRKEGDKAAIYRIPRHIRGAYISLIEQVQQHLLTKIERLHIAIECNPTSNYKIGEMERYDQHPILKFYNHGLQTPYPHHEVSVSINTDDSGIFATSIDREYALMALALEKRQDESFSNTPREIIEWLNSIRKMSVEQRFVKK